MVESFWRSAMSIRRSGVRWACSALANSVGRTSTASTRRWSSSDAAIPSWVTIWVSCDSTVRSLMTSSPHNPKVAGSNPVPATTKTWSEAISAQVLSRGTATDCNPTSVDHRHGVIVEVRANDATWAAIVRSSPRARGVDCIRAPWKPSNLAPYRIVALSDRRTT